MIDIFEDLGASFRSAMIERAGFLRWLIVGTLWLLGVTCWVLGVVASVQGFGLQGASIIMSGCTFVIVSGTAIFSFATNDIYKENN